MARYLLAFLTHYRGKTAHDVVCALTQVKIVPSLSAPGFCLTYTTGFNNFADASSYTDLTLRVRSTIEYTGFKVIVVERPPPPPSSFSLPFLQDRVFDERKLVFHDLKKFLATLSINHLSFRLLSRRPSRHRFIVALNSPCSKRTSRQASCHRASGQTFQSRSPTSPTRGALTRLGKQICEQFLFVLFPCFYFGKKPDSSLHPWPGRAHQHLCERPHLLPDS